MGDLVAAGEASAGSTSCREIQTGQWKRESGQRKSMPSSACGVPPTCLARSLWWVIWWACYSGNVLRLLVSAPNNCWRDKGWRWWWKWKSHTHPGTISASSLTRLMMEKSKLKMENQTHPKRRYLQVLCFSWRRERSKPKILGTIITTLVMMLLILLVSAKNKFFSDLNIVSIIVHKYYTFMLVIMW